MRALYLGEAAIITTATNCNISVEMFREDAKKFKALVGVWKAHLNLKTSSQEARQQMQPVQNGKENAQNSEMLHWTEVQNYIK